MSEENKPEKSKSGRDILLGLFWKLSAINDETRLTASNKLIEILTQRQKEYTDSNAESKGDTAAIWCADVKYTLGRLIHGLASERKASLLGFSCALTYLLKNLEISENSTIRKILDLVDENLKISNDKSEEKGVLMGRVFAFLAIIQSCNVVDAESAVKSMYQSFATYGKMKSYLKPICYHGITVLIKKVSNSVFDKVLWPEISELLAPGWEGCDAELFQVLNSCYKHQPDTCGKTFLKTNNWITQKSKKVELIGPHSYKYLGKMLASTTHCHPRIHPLCYEVVESVTKSDNDTFRKFWKESVDTGLLESSPERKYLALKLAIHVLPLIDDEQVTVVWSSHLIMSLLHALSNKNNPLHQVCKTELIDELASKVKLEEVSEKKQLGLLFQLFTSPAGLFLDDNTNTRYVQAVISSFHLSTVEKYVDWLKKLFLTGKMNCEGIKEVSLDTARRWSMTQLSHVVRNMRLPKQDGWLLSAIKFMFLHYHFIPKNPESSKISEVAEIDSSLPPVSDKARDHMKRCLDPALNALNSMTSLSSVEEKGVKKPRFHGTASDGEFWIDKLIKFTDSLLADPHVHPITEMDSDSLEAWETMLSKIKQIKEIERKDGSRIHEGTALRLLLAHVGIRLLNSTPDECTSTQEVLSDLFGVVEERFSEDKKDEESGGGRATAGTEIIWVEVIIETILSMLSQNSHTIRIVADRVFKLLSSQLTRKGLQLILHVLDPTKRKEILHNDDGLGEDDEDAMEEEGDRGEVEGMSDDSDESDSDDSAFDDEDVSDEGVDKIKFREKVKEALGDVAEESSDDEKSDGEGDEKDKSDSDPEMDDEAMMRIDNMLSEVFRQKKMTKRKSEQESQKQLLVFQLRCLDLIEIMASRNYSHEDADDADCLILETVRPLLVAVQHASRNASDMTLAEKASVLLRVKICKMRKYPKNLQPETISRCHDDIELMMSIAKKAHSVFMCHLASDCCLFLIRVLCGNLPKDGSVESHPCGVVEVERVQKIYKRALENFMMHRESRLQPCVIQDFITRYPVLAVGMASDLLKYIKDGVQVYRRSRACFMLYDLLRSPAGKEKCKVILFQVVSVMNQIIEKSSSSPSEIKSKYCVEVMRLYHQAISMLQSTDKLKSLNKSVLTTTLQKFVELSEVTKSQELTNWTWKVLHGFGVERNGKKQKGKKRKKTNSESEKNKELEEQKKNGIDDSTKDEDETKDNDSLSTSGETKKEMKARVLKEKKERRKGKKNKSESGEKEEEDEKPKKSEAAAPESPKKRKKKKNATQESVA